MATHTEEKPTPSNPRIKYRIISCYRPFFISFDLQSLRYIHCVAKEHNYNRIEKNRIDNLYLSSILKADNETAHKSLMTGK
jgi:hypothetical protein